ncbi:MAG: helix-turn-helix transcriptional regulator [Solirubrobacterales bacterium]
MDDGVGATLREARNRRKIDLAEVEAATKIRVRYLRAIENEEWEHLPGDAYARPFVRTYAAYLGLDAERLTEQLRRRGRGSVPAERLPRVDPRPSAPPARERRLSGMPPRLLAVLVSVALIAVLLVVGLTSGGSGGGSDGSTGPSSQVGRTGQANQPGATAKAGEQGKAIPGPLSLRLTATAEVWVCLLGKSGKPLVNGQILEAGQEAGPFRSGSFTVAMGNGSIEMSVDGKRTPISESASPVGYAIDHRGQLSEIPEGERPTCT